MNVRTENRFAVFSVEDDGGGFSEEVLEKLGNDNPAISWNRDTDTKRGMGLGLRVCRAIVRAHDGSFRFENISGGARVSFTLPLG